MQAKKKVMLAAIPLLMSATIPIKSLVSNNSMEPVIPQDQQSQVETHVEPVEPQAVEPTDPAPADPVESSPAPTPEPEPVVPSNNLHLGWMQDAGIAEADYSAVEELVTLISNWNVNAQGMNDGYGLGKLPKRLWQNLNCNITENPVDHLVCMNRYITTRYGSWGPALNRYQSSGTY